MDDKHTAPAKPGLTVEQQRELSMIIRKIRTYMENPTPLRTCLTIRNVWTVLSQAQEVLRRDVSIVNCPMDTIIHVVSPLKGSYPALVDVFSIGGPIPYYTYVFLGDIVGTGPNSIEVLCLILAYKVLYPTRVYVLVGESEIDFLHYVSETNLTKEELTPELMEKQMLTEPGSFASEIFRKYGSKLQEKLGNTETTTLKLLCGSLGALPAAARAGAYFCGTGIPTTELLGNPDDIRVTLSALTSINEREIKESLGITGNQSALERNLRTCLAKQNGRAAIISHWCWGGGDDRTSSGIAAQDEEPRFHYANDFQDKKTGQRVVPMFHIDTMHNIQRTLYLQNAEPTTNETREQLLDIPEGLIF